MIQNSSNYSRLSSLPGDERIGGFLAKESKKRRLEGANGEMYTYISVYRVREGEREGWRAREN
jgi:hypothetical protein